MRSLRRLDEHHFVRQHRIYRTLCIINSDDRSSDRLIDMCAGAGIAFIPWYPLAPGTLTARPDRPEARRHAESSPRSFAWLRSARDARAVPVVSDAAAGLVPTEAANGFA